MSPKGYDVPMPPAPRRLMVEHADPTDDTAYAIVVLRPDQWDQLRQIFREEIEVALDARNPTEEPPHGGYGC